MRLCGILPAGRYLMMGGVADEPERDGGQRVFLGKRSELGGESVSRGMILNDSFGWLRRSCIECGVEREGERE